MGFSRPPWRRAGATASFVIQGASCREQRAHRWQQPPRPRNTLPPPTSLVRTLSVPTSPLPPWLLSQRFPSRGPPRPAWPRPLKERAVGGAIPPACACPVDRSPRLPRYPLDSARFSQAPVTDRFARNIFPVAFPGKAISPTRSYSVQIPRRGSQVDCPLADTRQEDPPCAEHSETTPTGRRGDISAHSI